MKLKAPNLRTGQIHYVVYMSYECSGSRNVFTSLVQKHMFTK